MARAVYDIEIAMTCALTTYLVFPSWAQLVETLRAGKPPPANFDG